ncbi:MAG: hypothetical protein ACPG40_01365 [Alphaproteobacteria bacterium]
MISRRHLVTTGLAAAAFSTFAWPALGQNTRFRRVRSQYIAALGAEDATSGDNAHTWGHWPEDPGPIGVWLRDFEKLEANGGVGPKGWQFNRDDWWLDENGLLMMSPNFPMPSGRFLVTNAIDNVAMLTVAAPDADGKQSWELSDGRTLNDITHQKCRSARYRPTSEGAVCTPANAQKSAFPLSPGEDPPPVADCDRLVYAVPIIFAVEEEV